MIGMLKITHFNSTNDVIGDSGGPLLQPFAPGGDPSAGQPDLDFAVGITSFGDENSKCGRSPLPSVFTRISSFHNWIRNTIDVSIQSKISLILLIPVMKWLECIRIFIKDVYEVISFTKFGVYVL